MFGSLVNEMMNTIGGCGWMCEWASGVLEWLDMVRVGGCWRGGMVRGGGGLGSSSHMIS